MNTLHQLQAALKEMELSYATAEAKKETVETYLRETKEEIRALEKENERLAKVAQLFQLTAAFSREQSKTHIEALVTSCLRIVFSTDL